MPPPPPPPPPGPPPPPVSSLPPASAGRKNLLSSIEKGAKLRSTKGLMKDRSGPFIEGAADKIGNNGGKQVGNRAPPMIPTTGVRPRNEATSRIGGTPLQANVPAPPFKSSTAPPPPPGKTAGFGVHQQAQRQPQSPVSAPAPPRTAGSGGSWGNRPTEAPRPPSVPIVRHPTFPTPQSPSTTFRPSSGTAPPPPPTTPRQPTSTTQPSPRQSNSFGASTKPSPPPPVQSSRPFLPRSTTVEPGGSQSQSSFSNGASANRRSSASDARQQADVHSPPVVPPTRTPQPRAFAPPPLAPPSRVRAPPVSGPVFPPPVPQSKAPPLPPPRVPSSTSARSPMNGFASFECRFQFRSSKQLPRPERFRPSRKSYPSRHPHNKANRHASSTGQ